AYDFRPALDKTEILSGKIDELWHDEWRIPAPLVYENERTVVHTEEYVTEDGVHTNQVECLWSLIQPWLEKFRGLSTGIRAVRPNLRVRTDVEPRWSTTTEPC